jgi:ketosteroid isomerase-like protein
MYRNIVAAFIFVALLVLPSLFGQSTGAPLTEKTDTPVLRDKIESRERSLIAALNADDIDAVLRMCLDQPLSTEPTDYGWESAGTLLLSKGFIKVDYSSMSDVLVRPIGSDSAMITYRLRESGWARNSDMTYESDSRVTSIWVQQRSGDWKLLLQQAIEIPPPAIKPKTS